MPAPEERLAEKLEDGETASLMYLAGVSMWHEEPECPCIGSQGPRSKAMTRDMVFHLHFTGRLQPKRSSVLARLWRWWEIVCAPEPWPQRNHRPSLFQSPVTDRHDDP